MSSWRSRLRSVRISTIQRPPDAVDVGHNSLRVGDGLARVLGAVVGAWRTGSVGVGIAGRDVVAPEAPKGRGDVLRHLKTGGARQFPEADQVMAPRAAAKAVEESLWGQLARLLCGEAGPVVESGSVLQA